MINDRGVKMKVNPTFVTGSLLGGVYGSAIPVLLGLPFGPLGVIAAFAGASFGSACMLVASGDKVLYEESFCSEPEKSQESCLPSKLVNFQKVGYIRARRWEKPLTEEQISYLNEKFGDGDYET